MPYITSHNRFWLNSVMKVSSFSSHCQMQSMLDLLGFLLKFMSCRIFCEAEKFTVRTRARAVEVFTTLTSMICTMGEVNKSLQKSLLNPVLKTFSEALVAAIAAPDSHTSDPGLKTEVLKALTVLVKNVPKQVVAWLPQILPPVWGILTSSAEKYVREVVSEGGEDDELVDSDGEVLGFENLVFAIFEFVHALVDSNKFKSAVKAGLSELMYYIVIYMQVGGSIDFDTCLDFQSIR